MPIHMPPSLCGVLPRDADRLWSRMTSIFKVNRHLQSPCESNHFIFLKPCPEFLLNINKALYYRDNLHLNEHGYDLFLNAICQCLAHAGMEYEYAIGEPELVTPPVSTLLHPDPGTILHFPLIFHAQVSPLVAASWPAGFSSTFGGEFSLREVDFPPLPSVTAPRVTVPCITAPHVTVPCVTTPHITTPHNEVPSIDGPCIPDVTTIPSPDALCSNTRTWELGAILTYFLISVNEMLALVLHWRMLSLWCSPLLSSLFLFFTMCMLLIMFVLYTLKLFHNLSLVFMKILKFLGYYILKKIIGASAVSTRGSQTFCYF